MPSSKRQRGAARKAKKADDPLRPLINEGLRLPPFDVTKILDEDHIAFLETTDRGLRLLQLRVDVQHGKCEGHLCTFFPVLQTHRLFFISCHQLEQCWCRHYSRAQCSSFRVVRDPSRSRELDGTRYPRESFHLQGHLQTCLCTFCCSKLYSLATAPRQSMQRSDYSSG